MLTSKFVFLSKARKEAHSEKSFDTDGYDGYFQGDVSIML